MENLVKTIYDTNVGPGAVALFWLGGAGFALKTTSGRVAYIDPYVSNAVERLYSWKRLPFSPVLIKPSEMAADFVLTTHAHEDHLDPDGIPAIAEGSDAVFIGPSSCVKAMLDWGIPRDRLIELNYGDSKTLLGTEVSAVFAHHASSAGAKTPDAVGFVLDLEGVVLYHTGDTVYTPELKRTRRYHPDLMMVPINGQYGNMDAHEAARLTGEIQPRIVIPMHWGLFGENTVEPDEFLSALSSSGSSARAVVMKPGDRYLYSR